jgi:hypothetical protein
VGAQWLSCEDGAETAAHCIHGSSSCALIRRQRLHLQHAHALFACSYGRSCCRVAHCRHRGASDGCSCCRVARCRHRGAWCGLDEAPVEALCPRGSTHWEEAGLCSCHVAQPSSGPRQQSPLPGALQRLWGRHDLLGRCDAGLTLCTGPAYRPTGTSDGLVKQVACGKRDTRRAPEGGGLHDGRCCVAGDSRVGRSGMKDGTEL